MSIRDFFKMFFFYNYTANYTQHRLGFPPCYLIWIITSELQEAKQTACANKQHYEQAQFLVNPPDTVKLSVHITGVRGKHFCGCTHSSQSPESGERAPQQR